VLLDIVHEMKAKKMWGVLFKLDFEKTYDGVNWDFLSEVLRCKALDEVYTHMISQLVAGVQTAISINREVYPIS
jgi:hypothetical protein